MTKSRYFLFFCLSFILGVAVSSFFDINFCLIKVLLIWALIFICIWWKKWKVVSVGVCLLFFTLGIWRYGVAIQKGKNFTEKNISFYNEQTVSFRGIISEEPDIRIDKTQITVKAQEIIGKEAVTGKVLVFISKYSKQNYGDEIEINCEIQEPGEFDSFSYKNYLAKFDIYSVCYTPKKIVLLSENNGNNFYAMILKIKSSFKSVIVKIFPEPNASFLQALLLGDKGGFSQKLKDDFSRAGVSHIVAVSGYHVAIIAAFIGAILFFFNISRKKSFWLIVIFILFYIFLTGASASVIRAGIMGMIVLLAINSGRLSKAKNAIIFAACLMLILNPLLLRFDIGYLLSFAATLGIIYLFPLIERILNKIPDVLGIRSILAITLSAQIAVLPIVVYNFEQVSLVAPISNFLVLPVIPVTMLLGFLAVLCGFIFVSLGEIVGFFAWLLMSYEIKLVEILSEFSFSAWKMENISWAWCVGYYTILVIMYLLLKLKYKKQNEQSQ